MMHRRGRTVPHVNARDVNKISVVIPVLDEKGTLNKLYAGLVTSLRSITEDYELIFVDDGSSDGSYEIMESIAHSDAKVTVVKLSRRFGQTAAIMAGVERAGGGIIVTIDGDMQNDPYDLPHLVNKLNEGYDLVCGWRKDRAGSYIMRYIPANIAGRLISLLFNLNLHDYGCSFKAFRAESIKPFMLYGEMHRFIPIIFAQSGKKVTELIIRDHPRAYGKSKYGLKRVVKVLCDLVLLKFMFNYSSRPMHFFGTFGIVSGGFGCIAGFAAAYRMLLGRHQDVYFAVLVILSVLLIVTGIMALFVGILAEIGVRIYFDPSERPAGIVEKVINEKV